MEPRRGVLTSLIVKALLLGLALIIVGIPVAILVTPVGWALVAAGACVYFYVPAAAAFRAASKVQLRPGESPPAPYGPTILGWILRAVERTASRR